MCWMLAQDAGGVLAQTSTFIHCTEQEAQRGQTAAANHFHDFKKTQKAFLSIMTKRLTLEKAAGVLV
jgi:hypothetical protein